MRRRGLPIFVAFAVAVAATVLGAGGASAADQPKPAELYALADSGKLGDAAETSFELYIPPGAAQPAGLRLFVPTGYRLNLETPVGNFIGSGRIVWRFPALRSEPLDFAPDDPARHTSETCAPGSHAAVWVIEGYDPFRLTIPVYIDPTSAAETAYGGYDMRICFPRLAPMESLHLRFTLTNPRVAGSYVWRAVVVPGAGGLPDETGAYEVDSRVPLPQTFSARATWRAGVVTVTGSLKALGAPRDDVEVHLWSSDYPSAPFKTWTDAKGNYVFRLHVRPTARPRTLYLYAEALWMVEKCPVSNLSPLGCRDQTIAPAPGERRAVVIPKARKTRR